jgi:predicted NAD-dependent protein-ADP-ribosyltransferase YbiA (DUF1768 family)
MTHIHTDRVSFAVLPAVKAKRNGRQVKLRPDWDGVRLSVMEKVVRAKFMQNPSLGTGGEDETSRRNGACIQ